MQSRENIFLIRLPVVQMTNPNIEAWFTASGITADKEKTATILAALPLGDKKLSELYFKMKRIAGTTLGDAALKGLWTKWLPEFAQRVVAASAGTPAEFTKIADFMVDAVAPHQIKKIQAGPFNELKEFRAAVAELGKQFEKFTMRSGSRSRRPTVTTQHSHSHSRSSNNNRISECWYH